MIKESSGTRLWQNASKTQHTAHTPGLLCSVPAPYVYGASFSCLRFITYAEHVAGAAFAVDSSTLATSRAIAGRIGVFASPIVFFRADLKADRDVLARRRRWWSRLFIQVWAACSSFPAARLVKFPALLPACFVVGAGVDGLQTSGEPYAAITGPGKPSAPVRLTLGAGINSIGTTVAPISRAHLSLTDPTKFATPAAIANTVRGPYIAIAGALLLLGSRWRFLTCRTLTNRRGAPGEGGWPAASRSVWSYRTPFWARWESSCMWAWRLDWHRSR